MRIRNLTTFGFACALLLALEASAARPAPAPTVVPLVTPRVPSTPSAQYVSAWGHVKSYSGVLSGEIKQSGKSALSEHFQASVTLQRIPSPNPNPISFYGTAFIDTTGTGACGHGSTTKTSFVLLSVDLHTRKYELSAEPNPGALQLTGGPSGCPDYYNTVHIGEFKTKNAQLPAPSSGICATKTEQINLEGGGVESDKFSWKLVPTMDNPQTIKILCYTVP